MISHGNFTIHTEGNIIKAELIGSFNIEGATEFYSRLIEQVESLGSAPYCILIDVLKFDGATPEAYQEANESNRWINNHYPPKARVYILTKELKLEIAIEEEDERLSQAIEWIDNSNY